MVIKINLVLISKSTEVPHDIRIPNTTIISNMVARFTLATNHWDNLPNLAVISNRIIDEEVYFIGSRCPEFKAVIIILLAIAQPSLISPFGIKFLVMSRHIKSMWLPTAVFMTSHCSLQGIINGIIPLN